MAKKKLIRPAKKAAPTVKPKKGARLIKPKVVKQSPAITKALADGDRKKAMKLKRAELTQDVKDDGYLANLDIVVARMDRQKDGKPVKPKDHEWLGGGFNRVHFKIMGGKTVRRTFHQTFTTVLDAKKYFLEFKNVRKCILSPNELLATFPGSVDSVCSNYPILRILRNVPIPKEGLHEPVYERGEGGVEMPVRREAADPNEPPVHAMLGPSKPPKKATAVANGTLIPLKRVCTECEVEPRAARMKLRKAVKNKKDYPALAASHAHHARWEWPAGSDALADVKRAISGGK